MKTKMTLLKQTFRWCVRTSTPKFFATFLFIFYLVINGTAQMILDRLSIWAQVLLILKQILPAGVHTQDMYGFTAIAGYRFLQS